MMLGFPGLSAHGDSKGSSKQPEISQKSPSGGPKKLPRNAQDSTQRALRWAKSGPGQPKSPKMAQEGCQMALEGPSRALKWPGGATGTPRWPLGGPNGLPKMAPVGHLEPLQGTSRAFFEPS